MKTSGIQLLQRTAMSAAGVLICGLSVGMFRKAALGVDPFQSLMGGLNQVIPISFGTLYILANACLLSFSLVLDRRKIGLATIINLTLLGYAAELSQAGLDRLLPEVEIVPRLALLLAALVVMCIGSALYFNADLGVSTYDAVSLIVSQKWGLSFKVCRITSDVACVLTGSALCLLGGGGMKGVAEIVGIGTIAAAFFMGPLISFFSKRMPFAPDKSRE